MESSFHCPAHTGTMASGYGLNGGPSRCYPFWQEVMACYVTNTTPYDNSGAKNCVFPLEDYLECLHHKKEMSSPAEGMKTAKEIRSLGLLDAPLEEKHLK